MVSYTEEPWGIHSLLQFILMLCIIIILPVSFLMCSFIIILDVDSNLQSSARNVKVRWIKV